MLTTFRRRGILLGGIALLVSTLAMAADTKQSETSSSRELQKAVSFPFYAGVEYHSGNRRDPFLSLVPSKKNVQKGDEEESRGLPPPGIAGTYIAQAALVGTAVREESKLAIMKGADSRAYFLREGDRLFDGYLKTIAGDSVTLVRETKMRSGRILKREVTKQLRTP